MDRSWMEGQSLFLGSCGGMDWWGVFLFGGYGKGSIRFGSRQRKKQREEQGTRQWEGLLRLL